MPKNKPLAKVFHFDSFGKRQDKYDRLSNTSVDSVEWNELELKEPYYFFVPKDFAAEEKYNEGFSVTKIFPINGSGVKTDRDSLFIDDNKTDLKKRIEKLLGEDYDQSFIDKYNVKDSGSYKILGKIASNNFSEEKIVKINYRPFDFKWIYYDENVISRAGFKVMRNIVNEENISLLFKRQSIQDFSYALVSKSLCESCTFESAYANNSIFPLYLYSQQQDQLIADNLPHKKPNIDGEIVEEIEKKLGLIFLYDINDDYTECKDGTYFTPENLLDYIYAVLHSKSYRETYKEFLKIDFPKVPFDVSKKVFFTMADLGRELRSWHLLENEKLTPQNFITNYPEDGDNIVGKIKYEDGKVLINDEQFFDGVPENVWSFYIGGYQPAQKWLKDRKGRALEYEDILHYGKIILTLSETIRIMGEIEEVFEV